MNISIIYTLAERNLYCLLEEFFIDGTRARQQEAF